MVDVKYDTGRLLLYSGSSYDGWFTAEPSECGIANKTVWVRDASDNSASWTLLESLGRNDGPNYGVISLSSNGDIYLDYNRSKAFFELKNLNQKGQVNYM